MDIHRWDQPFTTSGGAEVTSHLCKPAESLLVSGCDRKGQGVEEFVVRQLTHTSGHSCLHQGKVCAAQNLLTGTGI